MSDLQLFESLLDTLLFVLRRKFDIEFIVSTKMECLTWYFSLQQPFLLQCCSNNFSNIVICPAPTPWFLKKQLERHARSAL